MRVHYLKDFYNQDFSQLPQVSVVLPAGVKGYLQRDSKHGVILLGPDDQVAIWNSDESGTQPTWCVQPLPLEEPDASQHEDLDEALDEAMELAGITR